MNNKDELYHSSMIYNTGFDDELYHFGIPGMKWGRRKAIIRGAKRSLGSGASRADKRAAVNKALAKDNAQRVKKYGANKVKRSNRLRNVGTVAGAAATLAVLNHIGKSKYGVAKAAAGAAALGVTIKSAKKINARRQDNKLITQKNKKAETNTKDNKRKVKKITRANRLLFGYNRGTSAVNGFIRGFSG